MKKTIKKKKNQKLARAKEKVAIPQSVTKNKTSMSKRDVANEILKEGLPTKEIQSVLKELASIEGNNKVKILEHKIKLGRLARTAKRIAEKEKIAFRTYVNSNFKDAVNRIYESIAIYRSHKAGVDQSLGGTVLMKIGQGMMSKNNETSKKYKLIVESKEIKTDNGSIPLKSDSRTKILKELSRKPDRQPKFKSLQKNVDASIELFSSRYKGDMGTDKQLFSPVIQKWIQCLQDLLLAR